MKHHQPHCRCEVCRAPGPQRFEQPSEYLRRRAVELRLIGANKQANAYESAAEELEER